MARRDFPNEANQPVPWLELILGSDEDRQRLVEALKAGNPAVAVHAGDGRTIHLNPMTLQPGEEQIVLHEYARLLEMENLEELQRRSE